MSKNKCFDDQWIVVTGACGFIGSCVIRTLNNLGFDKNIIAVDDFKESEKWLNLRGKRFGDFISRFELLDWLEENISSVEAIIHLGANSSTVGLDGDNYYWMNYRYSVDLAEIALEHNIRFIYASSAATYGSGDQGFVDDHQKLDSLRPMNRYGMSKHMFDLWALRNGAIDKLVGLKYFNVFGPNENHKGRMASMVVHMTRSIREEGVVRLFKSNDEKYADGGQKRDFVYVKDVAQATVEFLNNDLTGIFNIGSGEANTWNDLAKAIFHALGKTPNIEYIEMPEDLQRTYQNYTCADMTKLKSQMNVPNTPLGDAVKDYVQNYLVQGESW